MPNRKIGGTPMKLPQSPKIKWNYLALAFAIPCVAMLTVMLICEFEPFGQYAILYSIFYTRHFILQSFWLFVG